jgi:hypothetical protein
MSNSEQTLPPGVAAAALAQVKGLTDAEHRVLLYVLAVELGAVNPRNAYSARNVAAGTGLDSSWLEEGVLPRLLNDRRVVELVREGAGSRARELALAELSRWSVAWRGIAPNVRGDRARWRDAAEASSARAWSFTNAFGSGNVSPLRRGYNPDANPGGVGVPSPRRNRRSASGSMHPDATGTPAYQLSPRRKGAARDRVLDPDANVSPERADSFVIGKTSSFTKDEGPTDRVLVELNRRFGLTLWGGPLERVERATAELNGELGHVLDAIARQPSGLGVEGAVAVVESAARVARANRRAAGEPAPEAAGAVERRVRPPELPPCEVCGGSGFVPESDDRDARMRRCPGCGGARSPVGVPPVGHDGGGGVGALDELDEALERSAREAWA